MKTTCTLSAAAFCLSLLASSSFAALTVTHSWELGGVAGSPASSLLTDSVGSLDLTLTGSPVNGATGVVFGNTGGAFNVAATEYYSSALGDIAPANSARWGFEAVVNIGLLPAENQELAVFELGAGSGGIILQTFGNSAWGLHRSGVAITSDPNPVLVGQTQHLAAVLNGGSWQLWVDGALAASFLDVGYDPAAGIRLAAGDAGTGINRGFNGIIETVRVFDYDGTFDINDTLYPVPEPTSSLTALAGLGVLALRRRRQ